MTKKQTVSMLKKTMIFLLALVLFIPAMGCEQTQEQTSPPVADIVPTQSEGTEDPPSADNTEPPAEDTVPPADNPEPVDPEAALIAQFQDLLLWDGGETCYNGALTCVYDSPEDINLYYVFYNRFPDGEEWSDFTAEEQDYLLTEGAKKNLSFGSMPAQKRPTQQLDAMLQQYFGVSLPEVQIPDDWIYYEVTDSYYTSHSSVHVMEGQFFTVTGVEYGEDGMVYVYYTAEGTIFRQDGTALEGWEHDMVLTLRETDDGYVVMANQQLEAFQPPDLQEVINRILVGGLSYDDTWQSMGQYTLTTTQADGRVDTYVFEPEMFFSLGLTPGYQVANNYEWTQVDESQWTGLEGNEYSFRFANERYAFTVYSHEEKMELQVNGVTLYFAGTPGWGDSSGSTMYARFRPYAETALRQYERDICQVSGSETEYALIAQGLAEQYAKMVLDRPTWADFLAIDFRVGSAEMYDAYYGQDMPNFVFRMTYYLKVTERQRNFWETGSGLTEPSGSGLYGDYFRDGRYVYVVKSEDGNWHMAGMATGGATATLPGALEDATTGQMIEWYFLTEGWTHDWRILYYLAEKPLEEIKEQLNGLETEQRQELTDALLEYVTAYPNYAAWKAEDF